MHLDMVLLLLPRSLPTVRMEARRSGLHGLTVFVDEERNDLRQTQTKTMRELKTQAKVLADKATVAEDWVRKLTEERGRAAQIATRLRLASTAMLKTAKKHRLADLQAPLEQPTAGADGSATAGPSNKARTGTQGNAPG
ncbi:hypothetical protein OC842_007677 [Tilletia horrida]|uniref:Uncharacterized protein n=1 Tax=Tilletia horrida TaxID=155126 RepID=A0AAN6G3G4_9BASI|nr:hypothetical protein OC842_007677 [Tilletia horrida]